MTQVLQIGDRTITSAEIIPLLAGYQMLPQLWRELLVDSAIASIECTPEEKASSLEQFSKKHQLTTSTELNAWLEHYGMNYEQLQALSTRELRIEKFKQATWGWVWSKPVGESQRSRLNNHLLVGVVL